MNHYPAKHDGQRRAIDINDDMIQALYALGLKLQYCREVVQESPEQVRLALDDLLLDVDGMIEDFRTRIYRLRLTVRRRSNGGEG